MNEVVTKPEVSALLDTFKARLAGTQKEIARLQKTLLGEGFVVLCDGLAVRFENVSGFRTNPSICSLDRAPLFTKADAEKLASGVTNGAGTQAVAVHILQAFKDQAASLEESIGLVEAAIARQAS